MEDKRVKKTKEALVRENAALKDRLERFESEDLARRTVLSDLLGSYEYVSTDFYYTNNKKERKVLTRDWLGISFLIGELKADADFSILVEQRENNRREIERLTEELDALKAGTPAPTPLQ